LFHFETKKEKTHLKSFIFRFFILTSLVLLAALNSWSLTCKSQLLYSLQLQSQKKTFFSQLKKDLFRLAQNPHENALQISLIKESQEVALFEIEQLIQELPKKELALRKKLEHLHKQYSADEISWVQWHALSPLYAELTAHADTLLRNPKARNFVFPPYSYDAQSSSRVVNQTLLLPLMKPLSRHDMNLLWTNGLLPLGLMARGDVADGHWRNAWHFWMHDRFHAINAQGKFRQENSLQQSEFEKYWELHKYLKNKESQVREAVIAIAFQNIHEINYILQGADSYLFTLLRSLHSYDRTPMTARNKSYWLQKFLNGIQTRNPNYQNLMRETEDIRIEDWQKAFLFMYQEGL